MATNYRIFNVRLRRRIQISPSLLRCVFSGEDVAQMKHEAPDQRIKLLFAPQGSAGYAMPVSDSWYDDYLALPKSHRPVMRTYTLRALRAREREMDVEFVLHGESGPASQWAMHAQPGATLQIVAPDAHAANDSGGYEWTAGERLSQALLIADETALPAAMGILEQLAALDNPPRVQALFEVPLEGDVQRICFPFAEIHWLARNDCYAHGEPLLKAVKSQVCLPPAARLERPLLDDNIHKDERLWERAQRMDSFRAWVAGESTFVKNIRRCLINEHGLNRDLACFMAYWCQGKA